MPEFQEPSNLSSEILPVSMRLDTSICGDPPNSSSSCSTRPPRKPLWSIAGSKSWALPIFFTLRSAPFFFQTVNERLNGRVSNALFLRQTVEHLTDGAGSQLPELLQDSRLSP
jgi:hypothetical protein